ncbi:hypothetical protein ACYJ2U_001825 [Clostridium botulinum]
MKNVELKNLGIIIDIKTFSEDYKDKNIAFFGLLDNAVEDNTIKVYRAIEEENDYYNLIVIEHNNIYNAFPEPLLIEYMPIEDLENKISIEKIEKEEMNNIMRSQRETSYMYLKTQEDKAKLVLKLIKLTNGQLTKEEIEEIINSIWNTPLNPCFEIKVTYDSNDFGSQICEYDFYDSWGNWYTQDCTVMLNVNDNIKVGEKCDLDTIYKNPDFNIMKNQAVFIANQENEYKEAEEYLIIYIANNKSYKIDEKIQYILDNFDI